MPKGPQKVKNLKNLKNNYIRMQINFFILAIDILIIFSITLTGHFKHNTPKQHSPTNTKNEQHERK